MAQYPNPEDVVRPTTFPPKRPAQMTTWDGGKLTPIHNHFAYVEPSTGDGVTGVDAGHYHRVRAGQVLPSESDGHTHKLTGLPAGAG